MVNFKVLSNNPMSFSWRKACRVACRSIINAIIGCITGRISAPNIFLLGQFKCGSSSVASVLRSHGAAYSVFGKEPHFICGYKACWLDARLLKLLPPSFAYALKRALYLGCFQAVPRSRLLMDATVYNFAPRYAVDFIRRTSPEAKLIICLRDPVERAISHFFFEQRTKWLREHFPFATLQQCWEHQTTDLFLQHSNRVFEIKPPEIINLQDFYHYVETNIVQHGIYVTAVRGLLEVFDRNQVLIICLEDIIADQEQVMERLMSFLNVEYQHMPFPHVLAGTNRQNVDPELLHNMKSFYHPFNEDLFDLLGERFPW